MNETMITVQGNLATDVTLRTTKGGHLVASFRLASTPRRFDRATGDWIDGPSTFFSVSCWRNLAHNVKVSLAKGMPVVIHGRMTQRPYDREINGETVRSYSLDLDARLVGPDLNRGVAHFERVKSESVRLAEARAREEAEAAANNQPAGSAGPLVPDQTTGPLVPEQPVIRTQVQVPAQGPGAGRALDSDQVHTAA